MVNLGHMYRQGHVVGQSWKTAIRWYRAAAEKQHVAALHWLARIYDGLEDYPEDGPEAVRWLKRAAAAGDSRSQCNLAVRYINGDGVRKDPRRAARLYRASADQGDTWAQYLLGLCYRDGEGVRRNRRWALQWLDRAAADTPEARKAAAVLRLSC